MPRHPGSHSDPGCPGHPAPTTPHSKGDHPMAIRVTEASRATDKWARRASVAGPDYEAGIRGSGSAWETNARASNDAWKQGVTAAAGREAFAKGIAAAGGQKFESKALAKGTQRFGPGVAASTQDYSTNVAPYLQAISG